MVTTQCTRCQLGATSPWPGLACRSELSGGEEPRAISRISSPSCTCYSRTRCIRHTAADQSKRARHSLHEQACVDSRYRLRTVLSTCTCQQYAVRTQTQYILGLLKSQSHTHAVTHVPTTHQGCCSVVQDDVDSGYRFWKPSENKL